MKVRELVRVLHAIPNQEATVVIGEGSKPDVWLIVSGVVERSIGKQDANLDWVGPGDEPGIDIV